MSRKQQRMQDLREAKDRKMKRVAAALAVVLALVLAFEVPKVLHSGGSGSAAPAATTTATTTTGAPATTSATTAPGTAAAAVPPVTSTKLTTSDTLPKVGKSQLFSFSHFTAKDPFVQQVAATSSAGTAGTSGSSTSAAKNPSTGTTAAVTHRRSGRTLAVTGAARISVNGRVQVVRVGRSFPTANPLFRLVSVAGGVARIGLASGSYSSGARTVTLVAGRSLTLVDTADGIRYHLRLLSA